METDQLLSLTGHPQLSLFGMLHFAEPGEWLLQLLQKQSKL